MTEGMPESFKRILAPEGSAERPFETVLSEERLTRMLEDLAPAEKDLLQALRDQGSVLGGDYPALFARINDARMQVPVGGGRVEGTHYFTKIDMTYRSVIVRIDGEGYLSVSDV